LRLCLDRLIAPHRERLVPFALPPMRRPADLAAAMEAIASAVARGVLAPAEAAELAKVVDTFDTAIETRDFDSRLRELEEGRPLRHGLDGLQPHKNAPPRPGFAEQGRPRKAEDMLDFGR
jgi:hypothetical protein